jgi:hypothetical protein
MNRFTTDEKINFFEEVDLRSLNKAPAGDR